MNMVRKIVLFITFIFVFIILFFSKSINIKASSTPVLVTPYYNTNHYVVADFILSPSNDDMTSKIKSALKKCSNNGGGTVWLEKGIYNVSSPISIPSGCTLMGDWQDPDNYQGTLEYGTIIVVDVKTFQSDNSDISNTGLFKITASSGVEGLTIYYKNQNDTNPTKQPWSFYYGKGMLKSIKNVTLINSYYGIGRGTNESGAHEMLMIENVKGTILQKGVVIHNSSDVGTITGLTLKPDYLINANFTALGDKTRTINKSTFVSKLKERSGTGLLLTDAEQSQFVNITISGFKFGVHIPNNNLIKTRYMGSGSFYNLNVSDCTRGIMVDSGVYENKTLIDHRWGYVISNSSIAGSEYAILNASSKVGNNRGTIKLNDVTIKGQIGGDAPVIYNTGSSYTEAKKKIDLTGTINNSGRFSNLNLYRKLKNNGNNFKTISAGSSVTTINNALSSVSSSGGGVVYLEPGVYKINQSIIIPANVELRGSSASSSRIFNVGTVLNVVSNVKAIKINGNNSGIYGINIIYENNVTKLSKGSSYDKYSYSINIENSSNVYVKNVTIVAASHGIYLNNCKNYTLANIVTGVMDNAIKIENSDNGVIMNCLQNGSVICRNALFSIDEGTANFNYIMNPNTKKKLQYIYLNNATNTEMQNVFTYGSYIFIKATNSSLYSVNSGYDGGTNIFYETNNTKLVLVNALRMSGTNISNKGGSIGTYNVAKIGDINENDITGNVFKVSKKYISPYLKVTSSVSLNSLSSKNIDFKYDGDGKVTCKSSDTKYVKCSINANKQVVITPVANTNDSITLTISASKGKNYEAKSTTISVTVKSSSTYLQGDVDGDGKVGTMDYILIKKHLIKINILTGDKLTRADVDGNGKVEVADYLIIRKIILGIIK